MHCETVVCTLHALPSFTNSVASALGCALTFASEAKFEIEAKISLRLEAKKKPDFT
jgi:hypothetical protein